MRYLGSWCGYGQPHNRGRFVRWVGGAFIGDGCEWEQCQISFILVEEGKEGVILIVLAVWCVR